MKKEGKITKQRNVNELMTEDEIIYLLAAYYKNTGSLDGMYWILDEVKKSRKRINEQKLTKRALSLSHDIVIPKRKREKKM